MVMGFGPPGRRPRSHGGAPTRRRARGHDLRPPGPATAPTPSSRSRADPFMHQELIEILYHTLWETVHVFFEHRELGHDVGQAGFLYPFLGGERAGAAGPGGRGRRVDPDEGGRRRARCGRRSAREEAEHIARGRRGHPRTARARRKAHPLRQRRVRHRRQRLGARLRRAARRAAGRFRRSRWRWSRPT